MARPQVDRPGRHHRGARVLRLALRHWKALLQQAVGRRPLVRRLSAQKPRLLLQKRECAAEEEGLKSASGFPTRGPERLVQRGLHRTRLPGQSSSVSRKSYRKLLMA